MKIEELSEKLRKHIYNDILLRIKKNKKRVDEEDMKEINIKIYLQYLDSEESKQNRGKFFCMVYFKAIPIKLNIKKYFFEMFEVGNKCYILNTDLDVRDYSFTYKRYNTIAGYLLTEAEYLYLLDELNKDS